MRLLLALLIVTNLLWFALSEWQYREYSELVEKSWQYYSDARANDEAATECALKTGYKYNCPNGNQSAVCY